MKNFFIFQRIRRLHVHVHDSSTLSKGTLQFDLDLANAFLQKLVDSKKASKIAETTKDLGRNKVRLKLSVPDLGFEEQVEGRCNREARRQAKLSLASKLFHQLPDSWQYLPKKLIKELFPETKAIQEHTDTIKEVTACVQLHQQSISMKNDISRLVAELESVPLSEMPSKIFDLPNMEGRQFSKNLNYSLVDWNKFVTLPIRNQGMTLLKTIEENNVTIISAATGSGKTTQVPQFLAELYDTNQAYARIFVTQPRRIAAVSIAKRIAQERRERPGHSVGYCVRFDSLLPSCFARSTISLVTSGILLKMLQEDPLLLRATHLILDEVHERDVFTDTLLLISKMRLLQRRPDLKIVLMSATLSSEGLRNYFSAGDNIKIGQVLDLAGTNHPIGLFYLEDIKHILPPFPGDKEMNKFLEAEATVDKRPISVRIEKGASAAQQLPHKYLANFVAQIDFMDRPYSPLNVLINKSQGDSLGGILVFLPGWEEIMSTLKEMSYCLRGTNYRIFVLHSQGSAQYDLRSLTPLNEEDSDDVFVRSPPGIRKIVLATNIAESSVTIPDVVHVIDGGRQKVVFYDPGLRINCLEVAWASQANCAQRRGRAGRCQSGNYYVLMDKDRFYNLPATVAPEIARLDLAEVCLSLKAVGLEGTCQTILANACDPPNPKFVTLAIQELKNLGALNEEGNALTPLGNALTQFPMHPRLARMLLISVLMRCSESIMTAVSTIGERPYKPARTNYEKQNLRNTLESLLQGHEWGDHLLLTNLLSNNWKSIYHANPSLSFTGFQKMEKAKQQYARSLARTLNSFSFESEIQENSIMNVPSDDEDPWKLTRFVLSTGFYPDIAVHKGKRNTFRVYKIPKVRLVSQSCTYECSNNMNEDDENESKEEVNSNDEKRPRFYIFEELMDSGDKLMRRVTAIDPLFLVLSAQQVTTTTTTTNNLTQDKVVLVIDDFVRLEMNQIEASILLELRALWQRLLAVGIPLAVMGEKHPVVLESLDTVRKFIQIEGNIWRSSS